ncbi:MAG: ornithine cyclodeaminase family protein [bacterium]|nr:ornithine cyclodeaminase family protein [bacterium]
MKNTTLLYLNRSDVEKINIPMIDIINALDNMFREKGEGKVEMPPKPGIHTRPDSFIHAMPAYIPEAGSAGMKWVSGYPENLKKDLPYISGLLILNDPDTGIPISVMDCTWITAKRTGAATAVAAKYLARKDSSTAGIVACGIQGRSNLEALSCLFDIKRVNVYDINLETAEKYAVEMSLELGIEIVIADSVKEVVSSSDMVVTSGPILKEPTPAIKKDWLSEGSFACPLDFDSFWQGEAMKQADKFATDDKSQLDYYRTVGYFGDTPEPYADLGEIAAGKKPGRESDTERTMSMNLGLALDDMATAILIYKKARDMGIGQELEL